MRLRSHMDRVAERGMAGLVDCLREGWVRVDRSYELFHGALEAKERPCLCDQIGRVRADNVYAEDLVIFRLGYDLNETTGLVDHLRFPYSTEGEFTNLDLIAFLFGLRLREAKAPDLRRGVGAARHLPIIDRRRVLSCDVLDREYTLCARCVREEWFPGEDITDRVDSRFISSTELINVDKAPLYTDARPLKAESFGDRSTPDRDE